MMESKRFLLASLLVLLTLNVLHNAVEQRLAPAGHGLDNAAAMSRAERSAELFSGHGALPKVVVYGGSAVYFLLFPICLGTLVAALACRRNTDALRLTVVALYIDYFISAALFIALPLPERWHYAGSGASLLSNQWSYAFMVVTRPLSGLTHCFPSFHTSAMVIATWIAFLYGLRYRYTLAVASVLVMMSTLLLGIHWLSDVPAGIGAGLLSVSAARLVHRRRRVQPEAPPPVVVDASTAVTFPGTIPTPMTASREAT